MNISDKKAILQDYFNHQADIKDKVTARHKHDDARVRAFYEKDRELEARKLATEKHEQIKHKNAEALEKEVCQKENFIKKSLALNII